MAKILIKRGNKVSLPTLDTGEMGLCIDTKEVFIGNDSNLQFILTNDIINNVTSGGATKVLSAEQGKALKGLIDSLTTKVNSKANTSTVNSQLGGKINTSDIKNDLTSGGSANVLSAEQGKILKGLIDSLTTKVNAKADNTPVSTTVDGLMSAKDKVKLDTIAYGANSYAHPPTHPPSIIAQDATHRFVTDAEKTKWNALSNTTKSNLALAGSLVAATGYTNAIHLSKDGIVTINFGVRFHIENSNGLTTGQTLFTLPNNLRPKQGVIIPALAVRAGGLSNAIGYLYIRETGVVTFALVEDLTAYSQVCGCVTFSIN